ncbi:TPA: hypothetical protein ACNH29_004876 [Escherichia coli]
MTRIARRRHHSTEGVVAEGRTPSLTKRMSAEGCCSAATAVSP